MTINKLILTLGLTFFTTAAWADGTVDISVILKPAGSFQAQTQKVTGQAQKLPDGSVVAEHVAVDVNSLTTGIELRDKHLKKRLDSEKYPEAKLVKAVGKNGQGKATLEIKGQKVDVAGTYKIEGNSLKAEFKMHLPTLNIKDVKYMGVGVQDDITIAVSLPLVASAAAPMKSAPTPTKPAPGKKATPKKAPASVPNKKAKKSH